MPVRARSFEGSVGAGVVSAAPAPGRSAEFPREEQDERVPRFFFDLFGLGPESRLQFLRAKGIEAEPLPDGRVAILSEDGLWRVDNPKGVDFGDLRALGVDLATTALPVAKLTYAGRAGGFLGRLAQGAAAGLGVGAAKQVVGAASGYPTVGEEAPGALATETALGAVGPIIDAAAAGVKSGARRLFQPTSFREMASLRDDEILRRAFGQNIPPGRRSATGRVGISPSAREGVAAGSESFKEIIERTRAKIPEELSTTVRSLLDDMGPKEPFFVDFTKAHPTRSKTGDTYGNFRRMRAVRQPTAVSAREVNALLASGDEARIRRFAFELGLKGSRRKSLDALKKEIRAAPPPAKMLRPAKAGNYRVWSLDKGKKGWREFRLENVVDVRTTRPRAQLSALERRALAAHAFSRQLGPRIYGALGRTLASAGSLADAPHQVLQAIGREPRIVATILKPHLVAGSYAAGFAGQGLKALGRKLMHDAYPLIEALTYVEAPQLKGVIAAALRRFISRDWAAYRAAIYSLMLRPDFREAARRAFEVKHPPTA